MSKSVKMTVSVGQGVEEIHTLTFKIRSHYIIVEATDETGVSSGSFKVTRWTDCENEKHIKQLEKLKEILSYLDIALEVKIEEEEEEEKEGE